MAVRLSRRRIAQYCAQQLQKGDKNVIAQLAAYLVDERRTREAVLIVRDIELALSEQGTVIADVVSAHELSQNVTKQLQAHIRELTGAKNVQTRYAVDPSVIAGLRYTLPGQQYDGTVKTKLQNLRASKQ